MRGLRGKKLILAMVVLLMVALVAGCGGSKPAEAPKQEAPKQEAPKVVNISIATGATSGTYYPLGSGIANALNAAGIGVNATAESTGGSVENCRLMGQKKAEIGFSESGIAAWAYNGEQMFNSKIENLRGLIALYPNTMQTVVKESSGIKSYADLKGKRVGVGIQGSSSPLNMAFVIEQYGLTLNDIKPEYLSFGEAMQLLKDDRLDAVMVDSGAPNSAIIDIATQHKIRILPIEKEKIAAIKQKYGFFSDPVVIPAGTYKGVDVDITTTGSKVMIAVRADLPEDLVYNITKTLFEKRDDIIKAHPRGASIQLETALDSIAVPMHPGALKYYKEKGVAK
ncbi:MAG: TAXI family TRAP transporter solute-binding subunit [Bacillota bacterium]